jgi:hypothetical protein
MLTVAIRFGTNNSETTYIHEASDVATLTTATASHVFWTAPLAVPCEWKSAQVALLVQQEVPAVAPLNKEFLYVPAVVQMLEAAAAQLPVIALQQPAQLLTPNKHFWLAGGLNLFSSPSVLAHVTSAQVAWVEQQLATCSVAEVPAVAPFLLESLYFPEPQLTVVAAHVPEVTVQHVAATQLEAEPPQRVLVAVVVYPAGHVASPQVALEAQQLPCWSLVVVPAVALCLEGSLYCVAGQLPVHAAHVPEVTVQHVPAEQPATAPLHEVLAAVLL